MNFAEVTGTPVPPVGGGPGGSTGPGVPPESVLASSPEQAASASAAQASNATHRGRGRASSRSFSNVMSRTPILIGVEAGRHAGTRPGHHSACALAVSSARPGPWQTAQASVADDGVSALPPATSNAPPFCGHVRLGAPESWQVPQVPAVAVLQVSSEDVELVGARSGADRQRVVTSDVVGREARARPMARLAARQALRVSDCGEARHLAAWMLWIIAPMAIGARDVRVVPIAAARVVAHEAALRVAVAVAAVER